MMNNINMINECYIYKMSTLHVLNESDLNVTFTVIIDVIRAFAVYSFMI